MVHEKTVKGKLLAFILVVCVLLCFPVVPVRADSVAGAEKVTVADLTNKLSNLSLLAIGPFSVNMPAGVLNRGFTTNFSLFTIPDTKVGQEYIITLRMKNLRINYGSGTVNPTQFLYYYKQDDKKWIRVYKNSFPISDSGLISFKIDAIADSTPVVIAFCGYADTNSPYYTTQSNEQFDGYFSGFFPASYSAVEAGKVVNVFVPYLVANFSEMSYQLQVGGDELLDETKKQTEIMEEQKETSKGIFGAIKDFFGSFFDNLRDFFVSLIVPSSDDLTVFFTEVSDWFSARLGFIWYPFDLMLDLVTAFATGDADQNFTVPALSLNLMGETYQIWEGFEVNLDAFGIFQYVRYFTSVLLVCGIVKMAMSKWDEWIGGHGA